MKLTPADCLSVGYFILNFHKTIDFELDCCYVSEAAVESLMKQLRKPCNNKPGHIGIRLSNNLLTHKAVQCVGYTLAQTSGLGRLDLTGCFRFVTSSDITVFLKYIIEGISRNSTLDYLSLSACCLDPEHGYHLALMIRVSNINILDLSLNNFGSGIHLLVQAVVCSNVTALSLAECSISDHHLHSIGTALQGNASLAGLEIAKNLFSSLSFTKFLQLLIFNFGLQLITFNHPLTDEQKCIVEHVNQARRMHGVETTLHTVDKSMLDQRFEAFDRFAQSRVLPTK